MRSGIMRASLRTKVIAWSFVPTVIILSIVAIFVYQTYQRVIESQVLERDRQLTALRAEQMAMQLRDFTDALELLAATPDVSGFDGGALRVTLDWSAGRLQMFDGGVVVLKADGSVLVADARRTDAEAPSWPARPAVAALLEGHGQVMFSDVFVEQPGGPSVAVGVPVQGADKSLRGMLVGILRLGSAANNQLARLLGRAPAASSFYIVDALGRIVYHPDPALIGQDVSRFPVVRSALAGSGGARRTFSMSGDEILATDANLPGTPWRLIEEEDWKALAASYQGYERTLLVLLCLALIVPSLVVALGARRITRPVAELTRAAEQVAGGNLGQPIDVRTGDELEVLARQFSRMSGQLKESYEQLEGRVAARTRELSTLNAISRLVSRSLDVDEIVSTALEKTLEALSLEAGLAYRLSVDDEALALAAYRGVPVADLAGIARLTLPDAPASRRGGHGGPPELTPVESLPPGELQTFCRAQGWKATIRVPLAAKGRLLGTMALGLAEGRALAVEEQSLLAAIGQQAGVALENARLYAQAEQSAVAAERNRLARELHDSVTQTLFAASIIAGVLPTLWQRNPEKGRRQLEELRLLTQGALAEMRTLLLELRPARIVETPLGDLLEQLGAAATVRARVPIAVEVEGQGTQGGILPGDVQLVFYRVAQEALNNMAKYASASRAAVTLRFGSPAGSLPAGSVCLSIVDDGCGFDPASVSGLHFGLGIMRERAAAIGAGLTIDSRPGSGTCVQLTWGGDGRHQEEDA